MRSRSRLLRLGSGLAASALLVGGLSACSGDDEAGGGGGGGDDEPTAEEILEQAKSDFDATSGLTISLSTDNLPDGVTGVVAADGVGTRAPAFEGTITVRLLGNDVDVPVVSVDGVVYAQVPLTPGFQEVDPGEYGAPDPARLMSTDDGFSSLLTETTAVEDGGEERNPDDPSQVLRTISGTVDGATVENVIPSAEGDFDVVYGFEDDELRTVDLTGVFYPGSEEMTYVLEFTDYGTEQDITAP